jgi:hypothetical protein
MISLINNHKVHNKKKSHISDINVETSIIGWRYQKVPQEEHI